MGYLLPLRFLKSIAMKIGMQRALLTGFLGGLLSVSTLWAQGEAEMEISVPYYSQLAVLEWMEDPGPGEDVVAGVFSFLGAVGQGGLEFNPAGLGWVSLETTEL
jgi:hypothetical protein